MSSISSNIAASVTQGLVQQSQAARKDDLVKNHDQFKAEELRELFEQHVHAVESSKETDEHRQRVHVEQHDQQSAEQPVHPDVDDGETPRHIDVTA